MAGKHPCVAYCIPDVSVCAQSWPGIGMGFKYALEGLKGCFNTTSTGDKEWESCFSDVGLFCFSCCCPACVGMRNWSLATETACEGHLLCCLLAWGVSAFTGGAGAVLVCNGAHMRTKLRQKYNISGSPMCDCLCWWCCSPCAICQETATIAKHIGHTGDGPVAFCEKFVNGPGVAMKAPTKEDMTRA